MTRIDRYILFLYFRILCISFASVAGLWVVVNVFTNLDEFSRFAEHSNTHLASVLADYFTPDVILLFERLSGMLALLALLFVVAWLNKTHEFTALLAAGVTKRRVLRPLLIASAFVILGAAAIREFVIPNYQDKLSKNPQDLMGDFSRPIRPQYDPKTMVLLQGQHILPARQEIVGPNFGVKGGPLRRSIGNKLIAESAEFLPAGKHGPAGYLLSNVQQPAAIQTIESQYDEAGAPLLLTPSTDSSWLAPDQCFIASSINFGMLGGGTAWKEFASTPQLVSHIEGEDRGRSIGMRVQVHQRILRPVIDWTVLLLGIPVLLMRPDRHMFWVAGACLGVVAGFTAIAMGFAALGSAGNFVSPALAIWLPVLIFLPWAWARTGAAMET